MATDDKEKMHPAKGRDDGPAFNLMLLMFWVLILTAATFAIIGAQESRAKYRLAGQSIEIGVGMDRHFRIDGSIRGNTAIFLVDTGATITAIPSSLATQAQIGNCQSVTVNTANGPAKGCKAMLDALIIGPYRIPDVPVTIMERLDEALLGAEVLQRFNITQTAGKLILTPSQQQTVFLDEAKPARKLWNGKWTIAVLALAGSVFSFMSWRKSQRGI